MGPPDDSVFVCAPEFLPNGTPSLLVDKDDVLELLQERRLLREALTAAQERCGRLLEENRELKRRALDGVDGAGGEPYAGWDAEKVGGT